MSRELLGGIIEEINLRQIDPPVRSLREHLDGIDELAISIKERGLLQPVVVRPANNRFELVAGCQRFEACKRLGTKTIPCHVVELDDREAFEISLLENVQRKTLEPIEEARAFKRYVDEYGYGGVSDLARKIGKSEQYVSLRLQILNLPKAVLDKVTRRLVTPTHAAELLGLVEEDQILISELMVTDELSSKQVRSLAKWTRINRDTTFPFSPSSQHSDIANEVKDIGKIVDKCVVMLRITLFRLDGILDHVREDEWILREVLFEQRIAIHRQIDGLLRFKLKVRNHQSR